MASPERSADESANTDTVTQEEETSGLEPTENDILLGWGSYPYYPHQHVGNERLRESARLRCDEYRRAGKLDKTIISRELVQEIRGKKGRFLKHNGGRWWEEVGDVAAREKAAQILRDAYHYSRPSGIAVDEACPSPPPATKRQRTMEERDKQQRVPGKQPIQQSRGMARYGAATMRPGKTANGKTRDQHVPPGHHWYRAQQHPSFETPATAKRDEQHGRTIVNHPYLLTHYPPLEYCDRSNYYEFYNCGKRIHASRRGEGQRGMASCNPSSATMQQRTSTSWEAQDQHTSSEQHLRYYDAEQHTEPFVPPSTTTWDGKNLADYPPSDDSENSTNEETPLPFG